MSDLTPVQISTHEPKNGRFVSDEGLLEIGGKAWELPSVDDDLALPGLVVESIVEELIANRAELLVRREAERRLESAIRAAVFGLSALVEHPDDDYPDWMPALENSNTADASCLQEAWSALREALPAAPTHGGESA